MLMSFTQIVLRPGPTFSNILYGAVWPRHYARTGPWRLKVSHKDLRYMVLAVKMQRD